MKTLSTKDVIDFEPARVTAVLSNEEDIVVELPEQPCFSQADDNNPSAAPVYACEMRISEGKIELLDTNFPLETEYWEVKYEGGSRASFLPYNFTAHGPIKLTFFKGENNEPAIIVSGKQFSLEVL